MQRTKTSQANQRISAGKTAENDINRNSTGGGGKKPKVGAKNILGVSFGEASGSLLGVEATLEAGFGADGVADVSKEVGTLAITLPDVRLNDFSPDDTGKLSATTDDFADGSEDDDKRRAVAAGGSGGGRR